MKLLNGVKKNHQYAHARGGKKTYLKFITNNENFY